MDASQDHPRAVQTHRPPAGLIRRTLLLTIVMVSGVSLHAVPDETIVLRLKWWHQFQFAGYYAAQAKGFYQEEGLKVRIEEGRINESAIEAVLQSKAQFGVSDPSIVLAWMQGKPIIACAAVFQHSPDVIMSRRDRNIRSPSDLVGKKVMLGSPLGGAQFRAMLQREGIAPDNLQVVPHTWSINDLLEGRVDAVSAYATEEPIQMRSRGVEPSLLRAIDYGVDFYGDTLFTHGNQAELHKERTAAFIRASLRGWDYAMRNPGEIADLIMLMEGVRARDVTREKLLAEAAAMEPYILGNVIEVGHMNRGRWERIAQTYVDVGMAPKTISLDGFLFSAEPQSAAVLTRWVLRVGGGGALLFFLILFWNLQMRRRVRQRTRELNDEIARRTRTENDLRTSEERFRRLFTSAATGIAVTAPDGRFLQANPAYCFSTGYSESELQQLSITAITHSEDRPGYLRNVDGLLAGRMDHFVAEARCTGKTGKIIWKRASVSIVRGTDGTPGSLVIVAEDITARRSAEESASSSAELLRMASHIGRLGAWAVDFPEKKITWSDEVFKIHEVDTLFRPGLESALSFYPAESRRILEAAIEKGAGYDLELRFVTARGKSRWIRTTCATEHHDDGSLRRIYGIIQDITERRMASEKLESSEAQYRLLFTHNPLPMWVCDSTTLRFLAVNEASIRRYGYSEAEFLGMSLSDLRVPGSSVATTNPFDPTTSRSGRFRAKDGSLIDVEATSDEIVFDGQNAILTMGHDVTELVHVNRAQRMLSACNEALIRAETESALLNEICRVAVEIGGYRMAWVGFAQQDIEQTIRPVAHAGAEDGYLEQIELSWSANHPSGLGPAGRTIREGKPTLCENIAQDPHFIQWRELAQKHGYRSAICLPLSDETRTHGILGLHSADTLTISPREITLLQQLSDDLAFGIKTIRARIERQKTQEAVLNMARSVSTAVGGAFFDELTRGMVTTLGADIGVVAMVDPDNRSQARTLSVMAGDTRQPNFTYTLSGGPCEAVSPDAPCVVPCDVQRLFPSCTLMTELQAESYVGNPLINSDGVMIGIMAVLFRRPLEDTGFLTSTLRIFATRAASELDRQKVDSRLREQAALLDKAQDAIIVRRLDHGIAFWNKSAERLYGWTSQEAVGRSIPELLYKEPSAFFEATRQVISKGEWVGELHQINKSGAPVTVECRWTLVRDDSGVPRSILAINTDVTERRKLEHQFLRAQRMESIGTLAGGIAHDLNNVLAPVIMAVDLLRIKESDPQRLSLLGTIGSSARRGADMVSQVLSFARGVEGRRIEIQPRHLIHDIEKITQETFPKNIRIESKLTADLWALTGDPTQLHQVLLNLCVNARDAMPDGGNLTISSENVTLDEHYAAMNIEAKAGPYVLIEVEDNGTGIPPAVIEKIFDPFFTTKEVGKGTGLGLSTSLAIVKSHGGFIRVYSEPNSGSRFRVYLPALFREPAPSALIPGTDLPHGHGETILIIDDEPAIVNINRQTLEAFGYRVIVATDGAEGVARYAEHRQLITAVVIDMMMPVMDGATAIRSLIQINPAVRIIAASGIAANASSAKAAGPAVKHFLAKPYTAELLLTALRSVIDTPAG